LLSGQPGAGSGGYLDDSHGIPFLAPVPLILQGEGEVSGCADAHNEPGNDVSKSEDIPSLAWLER